MIRADGEKVMIPRTNRDAFWQTVGRAFARNNRRRWKYLAILALRENAGWRLEEIGIVFGHSKGHVSRCLRDVKEDLSKRFAISPDYLQLADEAEAD